MTEVNTAGLERLFEPFRLKQLTLKSRIVMALMTRSLSPDGVPGQDVAVYYARRAHGGAGLIIGEGITLDDPVSTSDRNIPCCTGRRRRRAGGR